MICRSRCHHPVAFASLVPFVTMIRHEYLDSLKRKVSNWVVKQVKPAPNLKASERNSFAYLRTTAKLPAALVASTLALHIKKEAVDEADPWYNPKGRKLDHTLTFPHDGAHLPTSACSQNRLNTILCVKCALFTIVVDHHWRSSLPVNSGARACS